MWLHTQSETKIRRGKDKDKIRRRGEKRRPKY
jgi:hypothetical protein